MFALSQAQVEEDVFEAAASTVESMEKKFGVVKGKRRNHTKGFCLEADFIPADKDILNYTTGPIFKDTSKIIGRLSHKDGQKPQLIINIINTAWA